MKVRVRSDHRRMRATLRFALASATTKIGARLSLGTAKLNMVDASSPADWAAAIAALGSMVAAGIATWAGIETAKRMREANRIAIFERKLECFRLYQAALSDVMQKGNSSGDTVLKMIQAIQASWFIFPEAVTAHLEEVYRDILQIGLHHDLTDAPDEHNNRSTHIDKKYEALARVTDELGKIAQYFRPHMEVKA